MPISKRISKLVSFVPTNTDTLYDLCCDHGQIGEYALESSVAKKVTFIDQVPKIMQSLSLRLSTVKNVCFETIGAQKYLYPNLSNQTYLIAGIGRTLCEKIINQILNCNVKEFHLVLCINNENHLLRDYLHNKKLKLVKEELLYENKQFYQVMLISNSDGDSISQFGIWSESNSENLSEYCLKEVKFWETQNKYRPSDLSKEALKYYLNLSK